ncbi:efflux RND transporter periplasmic adaptor subunit [Caminibacter sp.]
MKLIKFFIAIVIAALIVAGGVKIIKKRKAEEAGIPKPAVYPIVVKTYQPKEENLLLTLPYLALVKNSNEVTVNSKFAGRIEFVKELGEKVKKGDIVVKIDSSDLKAKLKSVNENIKSLKAKLTAQNIALNNLKLTHKRTKELLNVKMASIEQYQNEESKLAELKASIKATKNAIKAANANKKAILQNLTYTVLKSPVDGVISAKFLNKNDNTFLGKPILKITSNKGNYLFLTLPENRKEIVYKGRIYPLIALNSTYNGLKTFKSEVNDNTLLPGEKVNIDVVEFKGNATALPYNAILSVNDRHYVLIPQGNKALPQEIHILAEGKKVVAVREKINSPVILAEPDLLLKIKAGHPITVNSGK